MFLNFLSFLMKKTGGVSYEKVSDEIGKHLDISDITASNLQDDMIGPFNIEEIKEQVTKRMEDGGYMIIPSGHPRFVFQDFESYLRTEVDLIEDDIRLVLNKCNSSFITYELQPGIYNFKDLSEALFNILQPDNPACDSEILIRLDDITRKSKLVVRPRFINIRFDEKSFFKTILGFTAGWDYKHYNQYTSLKFVNLSSTKKIHSKCDLIDGSIHNGLRQPVFLFLF